MEVVVAGVGRNAALDGFHVGGGREVLDVLSGIRT